MSEPQTSAHPSDVDSRFKSDDRYRTELDLAALVRLLSELKREGRGLHDELRESLVAETTRKIGKLKRKLAKPQASRAEVKGKGKGRALRSMLAPQNGAAAQPAC